MGKRRPHGQARRPRGPRTNSQITEEQLRVITDGKGAELMSRNDALNLAREMGLDLVEVTAGQNPPICKIIDFGKWKYETQKKKREASKNQHVIHIKEIKLRPKIGVHDYEIKVKHAREFLEEGDKVKVSLRFRGREMAHPGLGMKLMDKMATDLVDVAGVETPAKMEGRQIVMVLGSKGRKKKPAPAAGGPATAAPTKGAAPAEKNEVDAGPPVPEEGSASSVLKG